MKEVDAVQVRDVDSASVGCLTVRAILLHMEPKETDLTAIDFFKDKQSLRPEGELLWKVSL